MYIPANNQYGPKEKLGGERESQGPLRRKYHYLKGSAGPKEANQWLCSVENVRTVFQNSFQISAKYSGWTLVRSDRTSIYTKGREDSNIYLARRVRLGQKSQTLVPEIAKMS